jgi:hypothetical protein
MGREVRVLSPYESRGDVELLAGLDPHRRGDGGRDAAGRRGEPGKAAGARVKSSSQDPEHENLNTQVT